MNLNLTLLKTTNRIHSIWLLCVCLFFSTAMFGQNQEVKLSKNNGISLKQAFSEIEKQTGLSIDYNSVVINTSLLRTIPSPNGTAEKILKELLKGTGYSHLFKGKHIIIYKDSKEQNIEEEFEITGQAIDLMNNPIIGANILIKDSSLGVITDIEGNFKIKAKIGDILQVSYIGYKSLEVTIVDRNPIKLRMKEDTEILNEVVVVGFGTQKKVNLTGSVGVAEAKELESRPVMNATQALQGLIPGLQISTNTGEMDKNMSINIRGTGTIGDGSSGSPLVLIDGMEGDLNSVNPQDIENISVLKDAAAASIYGSRAPFGVILITTKEGKTGKMSINYNNSFRISNPINLPKMMDSYTFANFFNSASLNGHAGLTFSEEVMQRMLDYQAGTDTNGVLASSNGQWGKPEHDPFTTAYANTDWYNELYKKSVFSQEHNFSLNGGTEKLSYYTSFNYLDQNGLLRHGKDGLNRYNATTKISTQITNWLKFNYSNRFTRTDSFRPTSYNSQLYEVIGRRTWPNLPIYDPNGYYFDSNASTPAMQLALGGDHKVQTDRLYQQASFLIEPIKNWVTHVEFNYSTMTADGTEVSLPLYNHNVEGYLINTNGTTSLYTDYTKEKYMNLNIFSEYSHSFAEKHNFKLMLGFQSEEMKQNFHSLKKYGLLVSDLPEFDLTTGTDGSGKAKSTETSGYHQEWATVGFFGRLNYNYKERYLAEVNMRYDGTSRFRRGNRWELYPSFSLGWNISREDFWEPLSNTCNSFKIRASYGELGNQNTTQWYPTYRKMIIQSNEGLWMQNGNLTNISKIGDLVSNTLTWETIRTWNVGFDFGFFNNRLTGSFDYYTRFTDNMVGPAPQLPLVLGIASPKTNNCDLKTKGWELTFAWNDQLNNGLNYGVRLMLSDAKTIIGSYPGNTTNSIDTYLARHEIGEIWGFESIGIAKSDEEMNAHLESVGGQNSIGVNWAAGDIMYKDIDGKPGITEGARTLEDHGDLKVIGNNTPRYQFGIDLSADWKGFDFRCFFQGVMKRDYWQGSNTFFGVVDALWWSAGLAEHNDYFRAEPIGLEGHKIPANLDAYYPRPLFKEGSKNRKPQSRYLQNAAYIRLKNLQLGYTLPVSITKKIGLEKCRLFVSGENLWTGTKLSDLFDPETISGGSSTANKDFVRNSGNSYPLSKTWSFGLSLTL